MKFGPVPVAEAEGAILAHSLKLPDRRLKKGHVIGAKDIASIVKSNIEDVIVALPESGDVNENEAAKRLAAALESDGIVAARAFTGRANLHVNRSGIFQADTRLINAINRVDPAITVATLADGVFAEEGRMVATVKIIPLAVSGDLLEKAAELARDSCAVSLAASKKMNVGLIQTILPSVKPSVLDKTRRILETRLKPSGSGTLHDELRVAHDTDELADAMDLLKGGCDLIVVFGASAIVDRADVIPAAIEQSGGCVDYLGMPVDPGNLLLIGGFKDETNDVIVIGAPGCARSPAENGFDWVLQRVIAGLPVTPAYISGLGVGGLLMEITGRPQPRDPA